MSATEALDASRATPSMAQYIEIKAANPDSLLFYRMGDFYELFFHDAEIASRVLGIVLTKRGKHGGEDIPMCGVPISRADDYLQRLIAAGYRVAVCEQLEDPAEARKRGAKAVVRRDVVRLVTPGTITEENLLSPQRANQLIALARLRDGDAGHEMALAIADISTGRFTLTATSEASLLADLARIEPSEIVLHEALLAEEPLASMLREQAAALSPSARDVFDGAQAEQRICDFFGVASLEGLGQFSRVECVAAAALITYVLKTQRGTRPPLSPPRRENRQDILLIDAATRANLELTRTLSGERQGSLLATIDDTVSPGGARLLAERLSSPLTGLEPIRLRQSSVSFFLDDAALRSDVRQALRQAPDITRALTRLAMERGGPRDLSALRDGILAAGRMAALIDRPAIPDEMREACTALRRLDPALAARLEQALGDDLPLMKRDGGFVREGFHAELDETRALRDASRKVIAALQARYAEETGARTLRIKYNNFLGYFVEVPQAAGEAFLREPFNALFIHRQTMQDAMRFSTAELSDLESRIASAGERATAIEIGLFDALARDVLAVDADIKAAADALSAIDVAASLAEIAEKRNWVRPALADSLDFAIEGARHPVVEAALKAQGKPFIANDCQLSGQADAGKILLITGPNMAGKSTFLRQNALIVILAQMGSHVPARAARIGLVDRLFSRVGASDDLSRGRSTFMVEMVETAAILNQATHRSLVILDEVGRGTATYDGLSIAWAVTEYLHEACRARALFATHYHELTALTGKLARLANATVRVTEWDGSIVFLHEVIEGAADRSYGIQVAKLAGLPDAVIERARQVLAELETQERDNPVERLIDDLPLFSMAKRQGAAASTTPSSPVLALLDAIHPDDLSPREALEALYRLKKAQKGV
jgi:DNA mismatch repair protein MutS